MHIGFDAKRYFHNRTGLGNYSRDLINTLLQQHPEDRFFLYDKRPDIKNLPSNTIAVPPLNGGWLWRERGIQSEIKRYQLDVFHGLSNELPFGKWPARVKKIVTIHDVIFRHFPEHYALLDRSIYHYKTKHALKIADVVVATSYATAKDLEQFYQVDPNKIHVVYQTCGQQHRHNYSASQVADIAIKYRLPETFLLYVSSFQTRKNHLALLKAFVQNKEQRSTLVLAGKPGNTLNEVKQFVSEYGLQDRVRLITDVASDELPLLYRAASGFVYPSMIEGFGIPLIEAAYANLPIAYNDIPVFRELAPEGSLAFDANDTKNFASVLMALESQAKRSYDSALQIFDPLKSAESIYQLYK